MPIASVAISMTRERRYSGHITTVGGHRWIKLKLDTLPNVQDGQRVSVKIDTPRSLRQHRLFFAMLNFACDHSDQWSSAEEVLNWIKAELGLWRTISLGDMNILQFESISFRDMSQKRFKQLFDQSAKLLAEKIGVDPLQFLTEMEKQ